MAQDQESSFKWFILISFLISWVSFFSGLLYGILGKIFAQDFLYVFGTIGPIIAFLSLMATYQNKEYNTSFWKRIYNPKIGPMWLILATVLLPIAVNLLMVMFSLIGKGPTFLLGIFVSKNGLFLLFSLVGILGWFGYAFPLLSKKILRIGALAKFKSINWALTGLIIGLIWSIWNIPVVFIPGSYPYILGVTSFGFWEFFLLFPIQSIIISWVYVKTENSTFVVLIFFLAEITRLFFTLSLAFQIIRFVLWFLIAGFIILDEIMFHLIPNPKIQDKV